MGLIVAIGVCTAEIEPSSLQSLRWLCLLYPECASGFRCEQGCLRGADLESRTLPTQSNFPISVRVVAHAFLPLCSFSLAPQSLVYVEFLSQKCDLAARRGVESSSLSSRSQFLAIPPRCFLSAKSVKEAIEKHGYGFFFRSSFVDSMETFQFQWRLFDLFSILFS